MSLRALHIFFILASIALSLFFGFWSTGYFGPVSHQFRGMGTAAFVLSGLLSVYLFFFISKIKAKKDA